MRISTLILRLNLHYLLKIIAHMFWLITVLVNYTPMPMIKTQLQISQM